MSFHVFLSHSSVDKPAAEELARRLLKEGIQTWLDKWHLIPGDPWQPAIERALAESGTCADGYYGALADEALGGDFGTPRMCFAPNNKTIACVESDGMVRLWRIQ